MLEKQSDFWDLPELDSTVISRDELRYVFDKIILSGDTVEHYHYKRHLTINNTGKRAPRKRDSSSNRYLEYKGRSINKTKNTIRRIVQANFDGKSKFYTLTFNNEQSFNINSIKVCDTRYRSFVKKLNKNYQDHRYLAVREFQKRGAVHYHMVSNCPIGTSDELTKIWGHGFTCVDPVTDTRGMGGYLAKYITKEFNDIRFKGLRTLISSIGLKRPVTIYGKEALSIINKLDEKGYNLTYGNFYGSEYNDEVAYRQYNLIQSPAQKDKT